MNIFSLIPVTHKRKKTFMAVTHLLWIKINKIKKPRNPVDIEFKSYVVELRFCHKKLVNLITC